MYSVLNTRLTYLTFAVFRVILEGSVHTQQSGRSMFKKKPKKYKLLDKETVQTSNGLTYDMHRIQALIDIPMHGVKAGDIGGYISLNKVLSHEGNCWVGENAMVHGYAEYGYVEGDALITENAFLKGTANGKSIIRGNAIIDSRVYGNADISGNVTLHGSDVRGNITLSGNLDISNINISAAEDGLVIVDGDISIHNTGKRYDKIGNEIPGQFIFANNDKTINLTGKLDLKNIGISGNCLIEGTGLRLDSISIDGDNTITGNPKILPDVKFSGTNHVSGDALIPPSSHLHDVTIETGIFSYLDSFTGSTVNQKSITVASNEYTDTINEIEADYESYTTDIVKLIKYPGMVDSSIPEVADFVVTLRMAKRAIKSSHEGKIEELAGKLELAFVRAENKVRTLVSSRLDETQKKSLKTAEKMFKIACDDASPEPEKRLGFKAGLKSLEGVLDVSEKAVENLKERVGILELEA